MEWLVEFEERRLPLDAVWSKDMDELVGPLKSKIDSALASAAGDDVEELKVVLYAEQGEGNGPIWGFKLVGPPYVVDYAHRLIDDAASIRRVPH